MTPIEEVKKLLDEREIKYTIDDSEYYEIIEWQGPYNLWWQFLYDPYEEAPYGELRLLDTGGSTNLTPDQAIAATVGEGTCHYEIAFFGDGKAWFACSECGGMASADYDPPKYCPHCGRKVVDA